MPQCDIYNSTPNHLEFSTLFNLVEKTILALDANAGQCKSRGHHIETYSAENIFINVGLLEKPYRDKAFTDKLTKNLLDIVCDLFKDTVLVTVNIYFLGQSYESSFGNR